MEFLQDDFTIKHYKKKKTNVAATAEQQKEIIYEYKLGSFYLEEILKCQEEIQEDNPGLKLYSKSMERLQDRISNSKLEELTPELLFGYEEHTRLKQF